MGIGQRLERGSVAIAHWLVLSPDDCGFWLIIGREFLRTFAYAVRLERCAA